MPSTRDNTEVVRDLFAAANEGDFARALGHHAPDVELAIPAGLEAGTYKGREALSAWFANWFASFAPGARFDIDELAELDGGRVLVVATHRAQGRASGAEIRGEVVWIYWLRDGRVVHIDGFESRDDALAAAGSAGGEQRSG